MNARDRQHISATAPQQVTRPVRILGVASGLGAELSGCADGPARLRLAGVDAHLAARGLVAQWGEALLPDAAPGEPAAEAVCRLCARLARAVAGAMGAGATPLVLGGDRSCAIGTWRGVAQAARGPVGLLWTAPCR